MVDKSEVRHGQCRRGVSSLVADIGLIDRKSLFICLSVSAISSDETRP